MTMYSDVLQASATGKSTGIFTAALTGAIRMEVANPRFSTLPAAFTPTEMGTHHCGKDTHVRPDAFSFWRDRRGCLAMH